MSGCHALCEASKQPASHLAVLCEGLKRGGPCLLTRRLEGAPVAGGLLQLLCQHQHCVLQRLNLCCLGTQLCLLLSPAQDSATFSVMC